MSDLASLTASGITLQPKFSASQLFYTGTTTAASTTISAVAVDPLTNVRSDDVTMVRTRGVYNGNAALSVGSNVFDIDTSLTTEDLGTLTKSYRITITRSASNNAAPASVAASGLTLSPAFSAGQNFYVATAPNATTNTTITVTAADANATVRGAGAKTLRVGSNVINVVITAADGRTTRTIRFTITRLAPAAKSSNANLTVLTATNATLVPAFSSAQLFYVARVANSVSTTTIAATAADSNATISGTGQKTLDVGSNVFDITADI